jgi:hypothetical protein
VAFFFFCRFEFSSENTLSVAMQFGAVFIFAEDSGYIIAIQNKPGKNPHLTENLKVQRQNE